MPTARQPLIFAICPTALPTAPEAADTTTVSPLFGSPMSRRPMYAVRPGMPRTPRYAEIGMSVPSILRTFVPSLTPYACHPVRATTLSPGLKPVCQQHLHIFLVHRVSPCDSAASAALRRSSKEAKSAAPSGLRETLEVVIGVAKLLRDHGEAPEAVAHLQLLGHAHGAMQLH